jgi:hypothetical protein
MLRSVAFACDYAADIINRAEQLITVDQKMLAGLLNVGRPLRSGFH